MKYAVIGTGAIGGYCGGRLAHAGHEVHFLLNSDYEYVARNGLRVDSHQGDFFLPRPIIYQAAHDMPQVDVVIVALKTTNLHLLSSLLPPLLHQDTLVLLIQNGIGPEETVQEMFPRAHLAAGLAFMGSAKVGPGHIHHQCYGQLSIGNYSCPSSQLIKRVVRDFTTSHIEAFEVCYKMARWRKAVWNMPFNGMSVVMGAQTTELLAHAPTRRLIHRQMLEVIGAARALGVTGLEDSFADEMIEVSTGMVPYSPSMKVDYDSHRPMEIEYLYSRPIAQARAAGFTMPCLEMLEAQLRFLETRR